MGLKVEFRGRVERGANVATDENGVRYAYIPVRVAVSDKGDESVFNLFVKDTGDNTFGSIVMNLKKDDIVHVSGELFIRNESVDESDRKVSKMYLDVFVGMIKSV